MKQFLVLLCLICSFGVNAQVYSLEFNKDNYSAQTFVFNGQEYKVRAFENIIYVANPVDTVYQKMNIYVPEEYFNGCKVGDYDQISAPVFFPNGVGGYMPSGPMNLLGNTGRNVFGQRGDQPNMPRPPVEGNTKQGSAIHYALSRGYVVASAGARGRSLQNGQGVYTGKAPAGLVDLKAAIKYLKYNSEVIPGNMNRIISNGTSAGGAMSTLLGATGNSEDYLPYLLELGAAQAPDNIFAVSAYCPITNLDNADGAYEWQFNGVNTYQARMMRFLDGQQGNTPISNELSPLQIKTSNELKVLFPLYINSLELSGKDGSYLTLDMDGEGSFKDLVIDYILQSANKAIGEGKDLSGIKWISLKDGKAVAMDFGEYVKLMQRMKTPPAFDAFDMDAPENHLFGTVSKQAQHFTDFSFNNSPSGGTLAQKDIIKMMNPMYYIGAQGADNAKYWHIRYGTIDNNTSLAIELILALWLEKYGHQVDFEFAWDRPHMGDYDLDELFEWMDIIVSY